MDRKFYLAAWRGEDGLTDKDAAKHYYELSVKKPDTKFDGAVYRFYSELIRQYPDLDTLSDEEMESSPWAASLDVAGDHVIMAVLWNQRAEVYEFVRKVANTHGLVCFDPQAQKVHLPRGQQIPVTSEISLDATATGEIAVSESAARAIAPVPAEQPQEPQAAMVVSQQTQEPAEMPSGAGESSSLLITGPAKAAYETVAKMMGCRLVFEETPELEQALAREVTVRISARLNHPEDRPAYLALTLISVRSHTAFRLSALDGGGGPQDWTVTVRAKSVGEK